MKIIIVLVILGSLAVIGARHPGAHGFRPVAFAVCGMALGSWGFGIIPTYLLLELRPLALFALAWVGLVIGMQADMKLWNRAGMKMVGLSLALGAGAAMMAALAVGLVLFLLGLHTGFVVAGAMVMGAAAAASSYFRARWDRLGNLARACAGLDDLVSLLFAILPFALINVSGEVASLKGTFIHMGVMAILGLIFGVAFIWLVGPRAKLDQRLALCIGIIALIAGVSANLGVAPFVVGGFAGIVLVNHEMAPKEKIYEVLVNAERPIGLFLMIFAGALVTDPSWLALALGGLWAASRFLGRSMAALWMKAPRGLEYKLIAVSPVVMVVTAGFVLLAPTSFAPLLLQSAVMGWLLTEIWMIWVNMLRGSRRQHD